MNYVRIEDTNLMKEHILVERALDSLQGKISPTLLSLSTHTRLCTHAHICTRRHTQHTHMQMCMHRHASNIHASTHQHTHT